MPPSDRHSADHYRGRAGNADQLAVDRRTLVSPSVPWRDWINPYVAEFNEREPFVAQED